MNVVFDVGNVLVRWSPPEVMRRALPGERDPEERARQFFGHPLWKALNRGLLTEQEAVGEYRAALAWETEAIERIFVQVKETQDLVPGTTDLMARLHEAGYPLFALTDNVREIMTYLRARYDFWRLFRGVVVSAEVAALKPEPEIFACLLGAHGLEAGDTVFIDDVARNVEGARRVGLRAIQFASVEQCDADLRALGLEFPASVPALSADDTPIG